MRRTQHLKLLLLLLISSCVLITLIVWHKQKDSQNSIAALRKEQHKKQLPLVLWWTPILAQYHVTRNCGFHSCHFSVKRELLAEAKVLLFYGSDMNKTDLPLPRLPTQLWALLHEESPKNIPFISHDAVLRHFNFTSTFSRYSDYPLTTQYLKDVRELTSPTYLVPVATKTMLQQKEKLAPIVFVQSICDTMSGRDNYVAELMQHIAVDSYGKCLNNKEMPEDLSVNYLNNLHSPSFYRFLARYKFILSYENGICNDYISEKFWRPLIIGSVPIYFGSPTIRDWQPNNKSVIHIDDFPNPKALADFIKHLNANDIEYNSYLDHKYAQLHPISNKLLEDTLIERYSDDNEEHLFADFECNVCRQLHEMPAKELHQANQAHYDCPEPLLYPPMSSESLQQLRKADWNSIAAVGKCQARVLDRLLQRNTNFTEQEFNDLLNHDIRTNKCSVQ